MEGSRVIVAPDPVQADMWFRLAARSPFHDNPNIRHHIETDMTSAQLDEARRLAAAFQPKTLDAVLAMPLDPPPVTGATARPWPPGLMGRALDMFKQAGEHPEPWARLPEFDKPDTVAAAIRAIAAHCEQGGQASCADYCRDRLDDIALPVRPGGIPPAELGKFLREHPGISPVVALRKAPPTAEQTMTGWAMCANRAADR